MGEFIVDWITVDEDAPAVGRSLAVGLQEDLPRLIELVMG